MGRSGSGRIVAIAVTVVIVGGVSALLYALFMDAADTPQTTFRPASDTAETIHNVYIIVFWLAAAVFVFIMGLTLAFSLMFREKPGVQAAQFHGNARLEVLWTLIPVAIVVFMAVPTFRAIAEMHGDPTGENLEVIAIGHQFFFEFWYPELGIVTANELHVPVDRPISITVRSTDVIHSFWVPRLAGKVDMVPGQDHRLWFTPNQVSDEPYLGQCAEFCGMGHANMRFRVFVQTQEDFDAWAERWQEGKPDPVDDLAQQGEQLFSQRACVACHTIRGNEAAQGVLGPNLTNFHERVTLAAGMLDNTPENLDRWLTDPQAVKPGNRMILPVELSAEDRLALIAYLLEQPE